MTVGTIKAVNGSGGMITLTMQADDGTLSIIHADNGPFVRAAQAAFGNVILPGHRFNPDALIGQRIEYTTTDWSDNMMAGFEPA